MTGYNLQTGRRELEVIILDNIPLLKFWSVEYWGTGILASYVSKAKVFYNIIKSVVNCFWPSFVQFLFNDIVLYYLADMNAHIYQNLYLL